MEQKKKVCENCIRFRRHYLRQDGFEQITFKQADFGHCVAPRPKARNQSAAACERYEDKESC